MDVAPPPVSLAAALALPRTPGRSAEVFVDGDLEFRFAARPTMGPQVPHPRDEIYVVARGSGEFICGDTRKKFQETDLLFVPAGISHRFEDFSDDLALWVIFYGPEGGEQPTGHT